MTTWAFWKEKDPDASGYSLISFADPLQKDAFTRPEDDKHWSVWQIRSDQIRWCNPSFPESYTAGD